MNHQFTDLAAFMQQLDNDHASLCISLNTLFLTVAWLQTPHDTTPQIVAWVGYTKIDTGEVMCYAPSASEVPLEGDEEIRDALFETSEFVRHVYARAAYHNLKILSGIWSE